MGLAIFCWMAPYKTQVQIRRRENLIFWLDALGKWSLCDSFVLIFIIVCIQIQTNPETLGLDASPNGIDIGNVELFITQEWGIYAFIAASFISLLLTHFLFYSHRQMAEEALGTKRQATRTETFRDSPNPSEKKERNTLANLCGPRYSSLYILPLIITSAALIVAGYFLKVVTFTYITQEGDPDVRMYSLWTIGRDLPSSTKNPSGFGIIWLQVMYYLLSLVIPVWGLLGISILFYYPLAMDQMDKFLFYMEINFAWSMVGPLVLSVLVSSKQLPVFANDIVQNECENCLTVVGGVEPAIAVVLIGALLQAVLTIYLFYGAKRVLDPA